MAFKTDQMSGNEVFMHALGAIEHMLCLNDKLPRAIDEYIEIIHEMDNDIHNGIIDSKTINRIVDNISHKATQKYSDHNFNQLKQIITAMYEHIDEIKIQLQTLKPFMDVLELKSEFADQYVMGEAQAAKKQPRMRT